MDGRVAQRGRLHGGGLGREHVRQPLRRQPEQEGELLLDRVLRADHPVLEDPPVELGDDLLRAAVGAGTPFDEQRGRLAERDGAGRIAAEVLHHARPDQLDRDGDLLDLVLAQQLAHHPPGEHPILPERAPDLGQVIGGRRRGRGRRRLARVAGVARRLFRVAPAPEDQRRQGDTGQEGQSAREQHDREPRRNPARGASGGGVGAGGGGAVGVAAGVGCCICGIGG